MSDEAGRRPPFDPRPYLRDGVLEVRARLLWLRSEHPEARIVTEHVALDDQQAIFRASVDVPGGGHATGYGAATHADGHDYIERAEERAVGRALATLGYGIQYASDFEAGAPEPSPIRAPIEAPRVAESPPRGRPELVQPVPEAAAMSESPEAAPSPRPNASQPSRPQEREPRVRAVPHEIAAEPVPVPAAPSGRETAEPEFEPADYNWTEFWRWARPLGYTRRSDLDKLLGVDTNALTPREVRQRLMEYRNIHGEDD